MRTTLGLTTVYGVIYCTIEHAKTAIALGARRQGAVVSCQHHDNLPAEWTVQP